MQPSSPMRKRPGVKRVESEAAQGNQIVLATQVDSLCIPKEVSLFKNNDSINSLTSTEEKRIFSDHGTSTMQVQKNTDKRRLALMSLIPQSRKSDPTVGEHKSIQRQTSRSIEEVVREKQSCRNSTEPPAMKQREERDEFVSDTNEKKAPPHTPVTNPRGTTPSETPQDIVTAANDPQPSKEYSSPKAGEQTLHRLNLEEKKDASTAMEIPKYQVQGFSCLHSGDFQFTKFLQRAWDCPRDQLLLLDRSTSWQHPENGRDSLKSNVPIALLKEFQSIAEQHRDSSKWINNTSDVSYKDQEVVESQVQLSGGIADEKSHVATPTKRVELGESADESVIEGWEDSPSPQARINNTIGILPDDSSGEESEPCVTAPAMGISTVRNQKAKAQNNAATVVPQNMGSSISTHEGTNKVSTDVEMTDSPHGSSSVTFPATNTLRSLNDFDKSIMINGDGERTISHKSDLPVHIAEAAEDSHKRFGPINETVTSKIVGAPKSKATSGLVQGSSAVDNEAELSTSRLHTAGDNRETGLGDPQDNLNTTVEIAALRKSPSIAIGSKEASAAEESHLNAADSWDAKSPATNMSVAVDAPATNVGILAASDGNSVSNSDVLDLESDGDDTDIEIIAPQAMISNVKHIEIPYMESCYSTQQPYTATWSTYTENAGGSGVSSPNELVGSQGHGKFPSPSNTNTISPSYVPKRKWSDADAFVIGTQEDYSPSSPLPPSSFADEVYEEQADRSKRPKNRHDSSPHLLRFDDKSRDYSGLDVYEDTTALSTPSVLVSSSQMWMSSHDAVLETLGEVQAKVDSSSLSARHNNRCDATQSSELGHTGATRTSNGLPDYSQNSNGSSVGIVHSTSNEMDTDIEPSSATFLAFEESQGRMHAVEEQAEQVVEVEHLEEEHDNDDDDDEVKQADQVEQLEEEGEEKDEDDDDDVVVVEQVEQEEKEEEKDDEEPWSSRDTPFNRWARDFRDLRIFGNVLSSTSSFPSPFSSSSSSSGDVSFVGGRGNAWAV